MSLRFLLSCAIVVTAFGLRTIESKLMFDIPGPSNNPFYGRTEILHNLTESLRSDGGVVIKGPYEIGKTEMVLKLIHSPEFRSTLSYDNYIWIHAQDEESLTTSFLKLANDSKINVPFRPKSSSFSSLGLEELKALVSKIYTKLITKNGEIEEDETTLFIFDDAYKKIPKRTVKVQVEDEVKKINLLDLLPSALLPSSSSPSRVKGHPHVVITTRDVFADWESSGLKVFFLDITTLEEVIQILSRELGLENPGNPHQEIIQLATHFEKKAPSSIRYPLEYLKKYTRDLKSTPEKLAFIQEYTREMDEIVQRFSKKFGTNEEESFWKNIDDDKMSTDIRENRDHDAIINPLLAEYAKLSKNDEGAVENNINLLEKLAEAYFYKSDYEESLRWHEKLLAAYRSTWGVDHHKTLDVQMTLANLCYLAEKHEQALELVKPVYLARKEMFGPDHEKTIRVVELYTQILPQLEEYESALRAAKTLFNHRKKRLGLDHPKTLETLFTVGQCHYHLGDGLKALDILREVYKRRKEVLGPEHQETLKVLLEMGGVSVMRGDPKEALEINEEAYQLTRKLFGDKHKHTIAALSSVSMALIGVKEFDKALMINAKNLEEALEVYGEDDPVVQTIRQLKKIFLEKQEDFLRSREEL